MPKIRVLVVDDYEPFRSFVCTTLGKRQDMHVVGEASDGLNAIRKAEELKPDLIVLDIDLPILNGIEAGRRIRKLCPASKILFLTLESSVEVAQEAFNLGAIAYIVKAHAGSELSAAVEAVCQGRRFVSKGLLGLNRADATDPHAPGHFFQQDVLPPLMRLMRYLRSSGSTSTILRPAVTKPVTRRPLLCSERAGMRCSVASKSWRLSWIGSAESLS
jgi:DNA-binding NarL/FixJ family response regulator